MSSAPAVAPPRGRSWTRRHISTAAPGPPTADALSATRPERARGPLGARRTPSVTKASTVGPAPETTAGTPRAAELGDQRERLRHRGLALLLVQEVLGGAQQLRRGVRRAPRPAARPARCWRPRRRAAPCRAAARAPRSVRTPCGGTKHDRRDRRVDRRTAAPRPPRPPGRVITKPPSRAGATLSGWPSSRLASDSAAASSSSAVTASDERAGQHDAADDRRRRRAHTAAVRDPVRAGQLQSRWAARPAARRRPASRGPPGASRRATTSSPSPLDVHLETRRGRPRRRACR